MTGRRPKQREARSDADEVERLRREIERLRQENAEQAKQIAEAEKQIADLERQLALRQQNSTTSSKPPSSDGLAGRQRERGRRKKSRRKPGGQPGHPGHCRPLVPVERVKERVDIFPDACRHCQHALPARGRVVTGELGTADADLALSADVTDPDDVARAVKEVVETFGHIDVLVNNAGITGSREATVCHETPIDEWDRVVAVNV